MSEAVGPAVPLTAAMKRFVLHWGEMGSRWGINRTVAQVHALLYISAEPLNAEQVTATLGVARSNVSLSLKELVDWGIVAKVAVLGDRRTHYASLTDVWDMFRRVVTERKRRELDPTFAVVRQCLEESGDGEEHFRERLRALVDFFDDLSVFYETLYALPQKSMQRLFRAGARLRRLFGGGRGP
jgi:DNA-binding transcriptional regulator GbsR (MarR family)